MNSIRSSLVAMLVAAFTLVTFLAAVNGYVSSMAEAQKLMDNQLHHAADLLAATNLSKGPPMVVQGEDGDFAFQVWRNNELLLRSASAPEAVISDFSAGFRYVNFSGYRWRILMRSGPDQTWYLLAERADLRHILAENVVLESILPLLLWLPVAAILIWVLVGWGLRPLRDLSVQINLKRSDNLEPVHYDDPPTELVQLVDSTNSLLSRLTAAFDREKHFAAHAAHELRTPLSVLKVHLHNLSQDLPADNTALEHVNAGVERMHHLVEQILDLNRTNPDVIKANFRTLDLHSLAQRVTASSWPAFAQKDQNLSLNGDAVAMLGDDVLLETLLQNLLDNANKYTPRGGSIRVTVSNTAGKPQLLVEDSGSGVSAEDEDRVFERFYRATNSEQEVVSGAGLGLAIVQHIVALHNADISLGKSRFESGLAVTVNFPAVHSGISQ
jgi:two-component system sensor histidine kinase QseC